MSGEMKVNRWRLPLVVGGLVVLAAAIAVLAGTLIAHDQKPQTTLATFAPKTPSPAAADADVGGRTACNLNKLADEQDQLLNPDAVGAILGAAKESADDSIRIKAALLSEQQKLAIAARGADDEARRVIQLHTASLELQTACVKAGY